MALRRPNQVTSSGIRPFGYTVEFGTPDAGGYVNPRNTTWNERLVQLAAVSLGYGTDGQTAQFSSWDPNSVSTSSGAAALLVPPVVGDVIRISINDGVTNRPVFKGTVRAVHQGTAASGTTWSAEAHSEIVRLDEAHFTGSFNLLNDPINPQPRFDARGQVDTKLYTVVEIIQRILEFKDTFGTTEYFGYGDIIWHGLDTDPRCGRFTPSHIQFNNTPKGRAILELLQAAGNFTYIYDPVADQIHIIELNQWASACGPLWNIAWASPTAVVAESGANYAYEYTVKEDRTQWNVKQTANLVRVVSGPIEWYSGHYVIPERVYCQKDNLGNDNIPDVGQDTAADQKARSVNLDLCFYRFVPPSTLGAADLRDVKQYYVGMPLFPDWNVFEDWFPAVYEIGNVQIPQTWKDSTARRHAGRSLRPTPARRNSSRTPSGMRRPRSASIWAMPTIFASTRHGPRTANVGLATAPAWSRRSTTTRTTSRTSRWCRKATAGSSR